MQINKLMLKKMLISFCKFNFKILFVLIFFNILLTNISKSQVIGNIQSLNGSLIYFNGDQEVEMSVYDDIGIKINYILNEFGDVTISLDDNSTLIFSKGAEFFFEKYNNIYSDDPLFELTVLKGDMIIETGDIPKITRDKTIIHTPMGSLFLNGTAVSTSFNGINSEIYLLKDTLGNVGELRLNNKNSEDLNFEVDKGYSFEGDVIEEKIADENKLNGVENLKEAIVKSVVLDDEEIDRIVNEKINSGKIKDQNGDGKLDKSDILDLKTKLLNQKENKLNSLITNTKNDSSLVTSIIAKSGNDQSAKVFNKIMENNPSITSNVVNEIIETSSGKFDSVIKADGNLFDKMIETVVKQIDEENNSIINIISKADNETSTKLLEKISDEKEDLLVNIIAETSKINSDKVSELVSTNDEIQNKVTEKIIESIKNDIGSEEKLKELIVSTDSKITSKVLDGIKESSPEIVSNAVKLAMSEDKEKLEKNLSKTISQKNTFSEIIIKEAILSGKKEIINNAVTISINENKTTATNAQNKEQVVLSQQQNLSNDKDILVPENFSNENIEKLNQISNILAETTNDLILNNELQEDENLIFEITEKLVSPN